MGLGIAAVLGSTLIGTYWLYKSLPKETLIAQPQYESRLWLKVSLPLFFISAMNVILKRTDIIMLDVIVGPEAVAYYSVATRLSDLAAFGLIFVNMVATPMISELYHQGKHQELQRILTLAARGIFVLTLIISAGLVLGGKLLLGVSGNAYIVAYTPLIILLLGQAFSASIGSTGFIMSMTGLQNQAAIIVAIVAVINIVLNAILIPHFGMNGAAIATAIATCLWNLLMLPIVLKKLKLNPTIL
jgi:O-antigen/teichoic acid export membrane protein